MEYIITKNGVVIAHCCGSKLPEAERGFTIFPCPAGFCGAEGDLVSDFTPDFVSYTPDKIRAIESVRRQELEEFFAVQREEMEKIAPELPKPSVEELEAAEARSYLYETDWYVTRFAETGKPVPDEVTAKRAACRKILSR